jgi:hypothetical protein
MLDPLGRGLENAHWNAGWTHADRAAPIWSMSFTRHENKVRGREGDASGGESGLEAGS